MFDRVRKSTLVSGFIFMGALVVKQHGIRPYGHVHEELVTFLRNVANPVSVKLLSIS